MARSEREKMLAGEGYLAWDAELLQARQRAREWCFRYNATPSTSTDLRRDLLKRFLGSVGKECWIEPPFQCDYGCNLYLGDQVYLNYNCVILDCATVTIEEGVMIGPAVQIYAAYHPIDPVVRRSGLEYAAPIRIGKNAWIGGGSILLPGIEIGENCVIGAGSVVTKSIPANTIAVGNPCRVLRSITESTA